MVCRRVQATSGITTYEQLSGLRACIPRLCGRGLRAFFAPHFHACVVSDCGHGVYFEFNHLRYPLVSASLCGPKAF